MGNFKRKCASCGNMTDKLYNFPSNLLIKEKWKDALGISELRPGDKICYLHFKDSDFQGRGLKRCGVLPSLKLHNQPDNIEHVQPEFHCNADMISPEPKEFDQNPWLVQKIADFNFLCCPECAFKSKIEEVFIEHAVESHPQSKLSKIFWEQPISKVPNDEFVSINLIDIIEENVTEANPNPSPESKKRKISLPDNIFSEQPELELSSEELAIKRLRNDIEIVNVPNKDACIDIFEEIATEAVRYDAQSDVIISQEETETLLKNHAVELHPNSKISSEIFSEQLTELRSEELSIPTLRNKTKIIKVSFGMGLLNRNVTTSKCLPDKNLVSSDLNNHSVEIDPNSKKSKISSGPHVELSEGLTTQSLRDDQKFINVPNNFDSIDILEENFTKSHQSIKLSYKCSLPTCNYYAPNGFFGFPKNEKQREEWQKLCGMETVKKKDRLCAQHFEESQISNLHTAQPRLKMGAMPSLNLPINAIEFQPAIDSSTIDPLELQIEDIKVDVEDIFVNINEEISEKPKTTLAKTISETKIDPLHIQVKCDYCDFSFENNTRLNLHIYDCHKELSLCKVCDHVFETLHDLKNHIKTVHEGQKPIHYDFSDFKTKRQKSLKKDNVKQLHKCHVCSGLEFKSEILLNSHIASIHKIKCEICDISFNFKVQLLKHMDKDHKNKLTIATKDGQKQKFQQNQKTKKKVVYKKRCVLQFCNYYDSDGLFGFPRKHFVKKKWLDALGLIEEDLKIDSRVCKQHFHSSHILECSKSTQRLRLKIGAIPTMNLTKNTPDTN